MVKTFIINAVILLLLFLSSGCKKNSPTEPQPTKPPGYQEDIPWPSLADSPWPMYRADPQNTGRSKSIGPMGILNWNIDTVQTACGVAISNDSSIYTVITNYPSSISGLVKYGLDGKLQWCRQFSVYRGTSLSSPLIDNEGTVYVSSPDEKKLYAIKSDGSLKWELNIGTQIFQTGINIGKDGNIYAIGLKDWRSWILYAIDRNGYVKWEADDLEIAGDEYNSMSFSPDGNVLYIPCPLNSHSIIAFGVNSKTVLWKFGKDRPILHSTPLIDSKGNIYLFSKDSMDNPTFYSLKSDGTVRWKYKIDFVSDMDSYNMFTMDKEGNLYLDVGKIISLDYDGKFRWSYEYVNVVNPLVCDAEGSIYFISIGNDKNLIKLSKNGEMIYTIEYPSSNIRDVFSLSIGYGQLFVPGYKNNILTSYK